MGNDSLVLSISGIRTAVLFSAEYYDDGGGSSNLFSTRPLITGAQNLWEFFWSWPPHTCEDFAEGRIVGGKQSQYSTIIIIPEHTVLSREDCQCFSLSLDNNSLGMFSVLLPLLLIFRRDDEYVWTDGGDSRSKGGANGGGACASVLVEEWVSWVPKKPGVVDDSVVFV